MDEPCRLALPDGTALSYRRWRAPGTPCTRTLLLLHGLASNHTRWAEFTEQTALKQDWTILRPDLRGHAESPTQGEIGLEIWCDDLRRLLDAEGADRAVIAGHSLGAQIACQFAARHPDRTQALVLLDPIYPPALHGGLALLRRLAPLLRLLIRLVRLLNRLGVRRRHYPLRDLRALDRATRALLAKTGRPGQIVQRYVAPGKDLRHLPLAHYLQELIEVTRPLPPPEALRIPIEILLSRGVTFTDVRIMHDWVAQLPSAGIQTIDAYHWPLTERPLEVRQAIEAFCDAHAGRRRAGGGLPAQ